MSEIALSVNDLFFAYGKGKKALEALRGLTFTVDAGKITALLGPNGSGKSTTFKILSTQLKASKGRVSVLGMELEKSECAVREALGVTFQSPSLDPMLTVEENLKIHAALYGLSTREADTRRGELLKLLGLGDRAGTRVKELSGGLARRAELAKSLLGAPRILMLDEPTTGLDPKAREDFWVLLRKLQQTGMTILVTTHLMDEADRCDELLFISEGKLAASGKPSILKKEFGADIIEFALADDLEDTETIIEMLLAQLNEVEDRVRRTGEKSFRIESKDPLRVLDLVKNFFGDRIQTLSWGKPTLADIYFAKTGKSLSL